MQFPYLAQSTLHLPSIVEAAQHLTAQPPWFLLCLLSLSHTHAHVRTHTEAGFGSKLKLTSPGCSQVDISQSPQLLACSLAHSHLKYLSKGEGFGFCILMCWGSREALGLALSRVWAGHTLHLLLVLPHPPDKANKQAAKEAG